MGNDADMESRSISTASWGEGRIVVEVGSIVSSVGCCVGGESPVIHCLAEGFWVGEVSRGKKKVITLSSESEAAVGIGRSNLRSTLGGQGRGSNLPFCPRDNEQPRNATNTKTSNSTMVSTSGEEAAPVDDERRKGRKLGERRQWGNGLRDETKRPDREGTPTGGTYGRTYGCGHRRPWPRKPLPMGRRT